MEYQEFLKSKIFNHASTGKTCDVSDVHEDDYTCGQWKESEPKGTGCVEMPAEPVRVGR